MNTSIANVLCLIVGFSSAYMLMSDTAGVFSPQKAEGLRVAIAFFLCFLGGWFTSAKADGAFHWIDIIAVTILGILAVVALCYPPIA